MSNAVNQALCKRAAHQEDFSKRQRLESDEGSSLKRFDLLLPPEIWQIVASHLQGDSLRNFSQASLEFYGPALSEKNVCALKQALQELRVLANLNPEFQQEVNSDLEFYQDYLAFIRNRDILAAHPEFTIQPERLSQLQHLVTTLSTQQVTQEFLSLSHACYREIKRHTISFEDLEEKYLHLKNHIVAQALNHVICSANDPQFLRGCTIEIASKKGRLGIVEFLLANGTISNDDRGLAVSSAASVGRADLVRLLLSSGPITDRCRNLTALKEAKRGNIEVMQALLSSGELTLFYRGFCVETAAEYGHLEIVRVLLASGSISDVYRNDALLAAVKGGRLAIVQALLSSGAIDARCRGLAVRKAAIRGYLEVVEALLANGSISPVDAKIALQHAEDKGYQHIALLLK